MRTSAVFAAALSLVSFAAANSPVSQTYPPPQVWKNANLVHIISAEKNYVKENINVLIENIAKQPQDEYFLPFTTDQLARLGGVEVKDRKDAKAGPFVAEIVEVDPKRNTQYLRIQLPTPLKPGAQQTIGISYYLLDAYKPLPATINIEDPQFLSYSFSAYCPSAYTTSKQKTEVKFAFSNIPDYTRLPGSGDVAEFPVKQGAKLTYGPFDEKAAGAVEPVQVRFEFNRPVNHVADLERDVEVSHWGGNVAFEERYTWIQGGANLTNHFSRVKYQHFRLPTWHILREMRFPLRVGSSDPYYTDVIGNISTSHFRSNKREALLEIKPRYPLFGGWKFPFTIGWNSDAQNFLRKTATGGYVLNVPFLEGPRQAEGVEYEHVQVRVILPEGAENVKYTTTIPSSSIVSAKVVIHKTFLDSVGRTSLVIKARNLVDDFRDRELVVSYDYPLTASLRKPIVVIASSMAFFAGIWLLGNLNLQFSK
ncbi:Ribophorin I [Schizothecium vesticola]|uniref:Dolichyl-diphosphooligosaccharide--protein glycosyltransferase subunit 1 n=1 Tax=Schizothecium vesticola TaxID=314040 RepID=A0AA40EV92_9PEZI|nr:Ribophorin I [Schizothecium vesticola]